MFFFGYDYGVLPNCVDLELFGINFNPSTDLEFFISALLVGSYLILRVVPVLVLVTMTFVIGSTLPNWLIIYSSVSVALSDLMDGLIYVIKAYLKSKEYVQSPLLTLKQRATTLS